MTFNDDLKLLQALFGAVEWHGEDGYRFGATTRTLTSVASLSPAGLRGETPLWAEQLVGDIYAAAYARRCLEPETLADRPPPPEPPVRPQVVPPAMVVEEVGSDGSIWANTRGIRFRLGPGEWAGETSAARRLRTGDVVWRISTPHQGSAQPFFHRVARHGGVSRSRPGALLRFYIHANLGSTRAVIDRLVMLCEPLQRPFLAKCWRSEQRLGRTDSVVLYVDRDCARAFRPALVTLINEHAAQLSPGVPLFARPLVGSGQIASLGLAEDPLSGQSFGMERARLLADVIMTLPSPDPERRLAKLAKVFRDAGLDPEMPHRNVRQHSRRGGPENWQLA